MINILLPVAGLAKRFIDHGHTMPKPLIAVNGKPMIKLALDSLLKNADPKECRLIFVVREDHCVNHDIAETLKVLFYDWNVEIAIVSHHTQGTLCSCLIARDLIRPDEPLIIYTPDVCFKADFDFNDIIENMTEAMADGVLLTFQANSPDHSYVAFGDDGFATKTAEKSVISTDALVGVYGFRTGQMFLDCADKAIAYGEKVNNEFYVAPIYNHLIKDNKRIYVCRTTKMYVLGTPSDLDFYEEHVARYQDGLQLALCCDHSGLEVKEKLKTVLDCLDVYYHDFGSHTSKASDHHDSLKPCLSYVLRHRDAMGVAICQTGQGFNIAANKVSGIRSVLISDEHGAELGRRHNAANFFCLPANKVNDPIILANIITSLLGSSFDGGRHATRIRKVMEDPFFSS